MYSANQQQLQKSDLRWLHLNILHHFHVILYIQEATRSDLSITCRKGDTPYDHSTELDVYLKLRVRVYSTEVVTRGSNAVLRRQGW
jgi:hypothetical protein